MPNVICLVCFEKQRQLAEMLFICFIPTHLGLSEGLFHKLIQFVSLPAAISCQAFSFRSKLLCIQLHSVSFWSYACITKSVVTTETKILRGHPEPMVNIFPLSWDSPNQYIIYIVIKSTGPKRTEITWNYPSDFLL